MIDTLFLEYLNVAEYDTGDTADVDYQNNLTLFLTNEDVPSIKEQAKYLHNDFQFVNPPYYLYKSYGTLALIAALGTITHFNAFIEKLNADANLFAYDKKIYLQEALLAAIQYNQIDIIKKILENVAKLDPDIIYLAFQQLMRSSNVNETDKSFFAQKLISHLHPNAFITLPDNILPFALKAALQRHNLKIVQGLLLNPQMKALLQSDPEFCAIIADDLKKMTFSSKTQSQREQNPVINQLLTYPLCFAAVRDSIMQDTSDKKDQYLLYLNTFVNEKLDTLRQQKQKKRWFTTFKLTDNDAHLFVEIKKYLDLSTCTIGTPQEKHALIAELLSIPVIQNLSERQLNAEQITDPESATSSLSDNEEAQLSQFLEKYPLPSKDSDEAKKQWRSLQNKLLAKYEQNPARLKGWFYGYQELPARWEDLRSLNLSYFSYRAALRAYHQHPVHTALRYVGLPNKKYNTDDTENIQENYLLEENKAHPLRNPLNQPNEWIATDVEYCYFISYTEPQLKRPHYGDFQPLILSLWQAVNDTSEEAAPTDDFTVEGRTKFFIHALAGLGRAHNFDQTLLKKIRNGLATKEYDDINEGDKPTCSAGIKKRLYQGIKGHPLFKLVTQDTINNELHEFVSAQIKPAISAMNAAEFNDLYIAWDNMIKGDVYDPSVISALNISSDKQNEFIQSIKTKYGAIFEPFEARLRRTIVLIGNNDSHAVNFSAHTHLDDFLEAEKQRRPSFIPIESLTEKAKPFESIFKTLCTSSYSLLGGGVYRNNIRMSDGAAKVYDAIKAYSDSGDTSEKTVESVQAEIQAILAQKAAVKLPFFSRRSKTTTALYSTLQQTPPQRRV